VLCTVSLLKGALIYIKLVRYSLYHRKVEVMYNLMKHAMFVSPDIQIRYHGHKFAFWTFNLLSFLHKKVSLWAHHDMCACVSLNFKFWTNGLSFMIGGMNVMTMERTPAPYFLKSFVFSDITLCSPLKVDRRFWGTYRFHLRCRKKAKQGKSIKKAENHETSVDFHRTIQRYILGGSTLQSHRCENLKSYILVHSYTL
jgi:hypothetical protein